MDYQVHIVDDDELACEWAVVEYAGTHFLFVKRGHNWPRARAEALLCARSRRAPRVLTG